MELNTDDIKGLSSLANEWGCNVEDIFVAVEELGLRDKEMVKNWLVDNEYIEGD